MNPEELPEQSTQNKHSLWQRQINVSPQIQLVLCLLSSISACAIVLLMDYPLSIKFNFFLYLTFWSSVGSLIGLVISKKRDRGLFWGAIIGAVLAAVLMS
jgi:hypothetical protein